MTSPLTKSTTNTCNYLYPKVFKNHPLVEYYLPMTTEIPTAPSNFSYDPNTTGNLPYSRMILFSLLQSNLNRILFSTLNVTNFAPR